MLERLHVDQIWKSNLHSAYGAFSIRDEFFGKYNYEFEWKTSKRIIFVYLVILYLMKAVSDFPPPP